MSGLDPFGTFVPLIVDCLECTFCNRSDRFDPIQAKLTGSDQNDRSGLLCAVLPGLGVDVRVEPVRTADGENTLDGCLGGEKGGRDTTVPLAGNALVRVVDGDTVPDVRNLQERPGCHVVEHFDHHVPDVVLLPLSADLDRCEQVDRVVVEVREVRDVLHENVVPEVRQARDDLLVPLAQLVHVVRVTRDGGFAGHEPDDRFQVVGDQGPDLDVGVNAGRLGRTGHVRLNVEQPGCGLHPTCPECLLEGVRPEGPDADLGPLVGDPVVPDEGLGGDTEGIPLKSVDDGRNGRKGDSAVVRHNVQLQSFGISRTFLHHLDYLDKTDK